MRGHMQQRGADELADQGLRRPRSTDGRKRYVERTVRGTRREAERELARLVVEVDEGRHAAAAPMTFGELLDRWLDGEAPARRAVDAGVATSGSPASTCGRRSGDRKLASLRPIDLDPLYADLYGAGPVAPDGADLPHGDAPVARAGPPVGPDRPQSRPSTPPRHRQRRRRSTPPTVDQVRRAPRRGVRRRTPTSARTCGCSPATGCRRGEACALRWTDVDLDRGELAIRRSIAMVGRRAAARRTPRPTSPAAWPSTRPRSACCASTACRHAASARWRSACARRRRAACSPTPRAGRGVPTCAPTGSAGCEAGSAWQRVRLHDLRHFVATVLGDGGVPIATISSRLGHRDIVDDAEHLHPRPPGHRPARRRLHRKPAGPPEVVRIRESGLHERA